MTKYNVKEYIYDDLGGFYSPKWRYKVASLEEAAADFKRLVRDGYYGGWGETSGIKDGIVRARLELLDDNENIVDKGYIAGFCRGHITAPPVINAEFLEVSRTLDGPHTILDIRLIIYKMDLVLAKLEIKENDFIFVETSAWLDQVQLGTVIDRGGTNYVAVYSRMHRFDLQKYKTWS